MFRFFDLFNNDTKLKKLFLPKDKKICTEIISADLFDQTKFTFSNIRRRQPAGWQQWLRQDFLRYDVFQACEPTLHL